MYERSSSEFRIQKIHALEEWKVLEGYYTYPSRSSRHQTCSLHCNVSGYVPDTVLEGVRTYLRAGAVDASHPPADLIYSHPPLRKFLRGGYIYGISVKGLPRTHHPIALNSNDCLSLLRSSCLTLSRSFKFCRKGLSFLQSTTSALHLQYLDYSYSYLLASVASTFWLTFWQSFRVGRARKAAGIPYPQGGPHIRQCTHTSARTY